MSAKRLKTATYHTRKGIPLPSFGVESPNSSLAASSGVEASPRTTAAALTPCAADRKETLLKNLSDDERKAILNFSAAAEMQLHRLPSGRNRRMPLHIFYDLMEKSEGLKILGMPNDYDEWETEKEAFLYKFLFVTATAGLFEIYHEDAQAAFTSSQGTDDRQEARRWYLRQPLPQNGDARVGLNEVRTVLFDPSREISPGANADELRAAVLSLRPKTPLPQPSLDQCVQSTNSDQMDTDPSPVTALGESTVEERVRAKREKRRREEQLREPAENPGTSQDNPLMLRIADLLWTRSRQIWKRHQDFASPERKGQSSPCNFTLSDIVKTIQTKNSASGNVMSKRQVVELLQGLCQKVPEWIHHSSSKQGGNWDQDDTLWLKPIDYQVVRGRILGKTSTDAPATSTVFESTAKTDRVVATNSADSNQDGSDGSEKKSWKKRLRPTNALVSAAKRQLWKDKGDPEPARAGVAAATKDVSPPATKKAKTFPEAANTVSSPRRRLRVNPHLIMTDADHQGGERIVPSRKDSPRGLKNLFRQLNSGKRI